MDFDSRVPISREDAMWQMNLGSEETMVGDGSFPKRPGEPDCSYYIRTGLCRFGSTCRFNHPHDRKLVIATTRIKGEYPERIGEPECEFYLKTGTCKFKVTCKFHHPRNKAGTGGRVSHNVLGYPLRPDEDDCSYFLRTGHCKFGGTCKFNHPQSQSTNLMVSLRGSPVYSALQSPTGQESYSCSRASSVSQGGLFSSLFHSGNSVPLGYYALPRENAFPERPGLPECVFYMKTGDCKFGAVCKFHHPRGRQTPASDGVLSPVGLPLRPGEPLCVFYSRYGICKFGPSCKFDHPMRVFTYNNNASPSSSSSSSSSSSLHQETITTQLRNHLVSSSVEATHTAVPSVSETASAKDTIVDSQH